MVKFGSERKLENRWRKKMKDDGMDAAKNLRQALCSQPLAQFFSSIFPRTLARSQTIAPIMLRIKIAETIPSALSRPLAKPWYVSPRPQPR